MTPFIRVLLLAATSALLASAPAFAADSMIRISCDGADAGAEVTVNGVFKGECPLDIQVDAGTLKIRAVKAVPGGRERVFETETKVGSGVAKRVEVQLGGARLTPEGQVAETARIAAEQAEAQRRADADRAAAAAAQQAEHEALSAGQVKVAEQLDPLVTQALGDMRAKHVTGIDGCPDCPRAFIAGKSMKLEVPTLPAPDVDAMLAKATGEARLVLSGGGAPFAPPPVPPSLPCDGAEPLMRKLAGLESMKDQTLEAQRGFIDAGKSLGRVGQYARDVKFWPLHATCTDGKLAGPLEYWAFGVTVFAFGDSVSIEPTLSLVSANVVDSATAGSMRKVSHGVRRTFDANTYKPSDVDLGYDSLVYGDHEVTGASMWAGITLSLGRMQSAGQADTAIVTTAVITARGGDRFIMDLYQGSRQQSRTGYRHGKPHGTMSIFPQTIPVGTFIPDIHVPGSVQCFQDGKSVELRPCPQE